MPLPFPQNGTFIQKVRETSRQTRERAHIKISVPAIDQLLKSTLDESTFTRLKSHHGVSSFPLRFPNLLSEINFLSILSLLNTLSGYRLALHAATGDGAYQSIIRILVGLFISGDQTLSAQGLKTLSADEVASILGVSLFEEKAHPTLPGVTVGSKGGQVAEAVEIVVKACNETGERLVAKGYPSLGALVMEILEESEKITKEKDDLAGADHFIERLVTAIPGFADQTLLSTPEGDKPVYIYKKAFFLLFSLYQRLDPRSPAKTSSDGEKITVPSPDVIPMFIDNVLCTMLVHLQVLDLEQCSVPTLQAWGIKAEGFKQAVREGAKVEDIEKHVDGPVLTKDEAYMVRAAALDAGKVILERVKALQHEPGLEWFEGINEADVDGYLWAVAKDDPLLRKVPRMVEKKTMMY